MVDTGKRPRSQRDNEIDSKRHKRRALDGDGNGGDELVVYRILCPDGVIGSVIGKGGKVINSIRQDTRAKVKVVDPFPGSKTRVITIYCYVKAKESFDLDDDFDERKPLCPAQDALIRVHSAIAASVASAQSESDNGKGRRDRVECQLLVPTSQSGAVIGKAGSTIKRLRTKTLANVKVNPKDSSDPKQSCAMDFDNFVMITGEPDAVKKALFAVSAIMYRCTPKEDIPLDTNVPENPSSIIIPAEMPIYPSTGLYPGAAEPLLSSGAIPPILASLPELGGFGDAGNPWPMLPPTLAVASGIGGSSQSEELIVRVLCPFDKIGRVIGKGGSTIKNIRQATGACVDINDSKNDRDECIIIISSNESPDDMKSMAVEAILMLQGKINDEDDETVSMRLLIPSKVIGCLIGKSGSIINEIRKITKADIRISKGKLPKCAESNEELVEIDGEVGNVRDALVQIVLRLREDVMKEKDGKQNPSGGTDSFYIGGGPGLSLSSMLPHVPQVAPLSYDQRAESGSGMGVVSSSSLYGYNSLSMGDNAYGRMSYTSKFYNDLAPPSTAIEVLVPANAVGKVMGKGGSNIANMRKISGAMIEISDPKSSRGDRIAHISGTPEQKRLAENLIQAFIMST